jgi:hypothetical protein
MNKEAVKIARKQAGQGKLLYGEKRGFQTTNEYVTIIIGAPRELQYMHGGADIYFYNKGENSFDFRVLESGNIDGLLQETNAPSDSNMVATLSGSVAPNDDPPLAGDKQLMVSRPTNIKIQVKSTVDDTPTVVEVEFKGTEL